MLNQEKAPHWDKTPGIREIIISGSAYNKEMTKEYWVISAVDPAGRVVAEKRGVKRKKLTKPRGLNTM
jgi:hypothetical protein